MHTSVSGIQSLVMLPRAWNSVRRVPISYASLPCRLGREAVSFVLTARQIQDQTAVKRDRPSKSQEQRNESSYAGRPGKSAGRLPAFVLLAVGLPVGWYLSTLKQRSRYQTSLDPTLFVRYSITDKEDVSSTCAIFTLRPVAGAGIAASDPCAEWAITSVEFKQPQLQIARSYTCLPPLTGQDPDELRFLIRREQHGEVSSFLHQLPVGAEVEIRGPFVEFVIPDDVKTAVFIAGGTGIAPALQAADVLDGEADLHILWAVRRREDCIGGVSDTPQQPTFSDLRAWSISFSTKGGSASVLPSVVQRGSIVTQLENLKASYAASPSGQPRLTVDYLVDEENTRLDAARIRNCVKARSYTERDGHRRRNVIFVSGPAGFINYWAGPKQWTNGQEVQGPLGGVLSTMGLEDWDIVKL